MPVNRLAEIWGATKNIIPGIILVAVAVCEEMPVTATVSAGIPARPTPAGPLLLYQV